MATPAQFPPLLNILALHTEHVLSVAGQPFFIVIVHRLFGLALRAIGSRGSIHCGFGMFI
jgi:hypothetical protein